SDEERQEVLAELHLDEESRVELAGLLGHELKESGLEKPLFGSIGRELVGSFDGPDASIPERIGDYRILRKIGEGGMGIVYAGRRDDSDTLVALKVIRQGIGGSGLEQRFTREARVLERLKHPGIAAYLESGQVRVQVGVESTTLPFLAMEYVDGEPLLQHTRSASLDDRARLELLARICDAVHHAHSLGVVHRD
ncbi:MAG: protein kinase, partial [bacterium]|nr:protein kinase [bacterium]